LDRYVGIRYRPNHFDVICRRQLQHKVDGHQTIAVDAAVALLNTQPAIGIRNIARASRIVLPQPHVDIVNLRVGVDELNRKRQAVSSRLRERDAAV
jgi:hypothetical protein